MSAKNVVDDWEGLDDSELNSKLDQLKKNATNSKLNATSTNSTIENVNIPQIASMLMNDDENCLRTPYAPPEPTVKILKRPTSDKVNKSAVDTKPKAPVKTLQQREQEYAEARLRILGSAKSAEEEEEANAVLTIRNESSNNLTNGKVNGFSDYSNISSSTNSSSSSLSSTGGNAGNGNGKPNSRNFNAINNGASSKTFIRNYQLPQQPEIRRIDENVIRLPRGPDGTSGFLLKR